MFKIDAEDPRRGLDLSPLRGSDQKRNRRPRGSRPGLTSIAAPRLHFHFDGRVGPRFTSSTFLHLTEFRMSQTFERRALNDSLTIRRQQVELRAILKALERWIGQDEVGVVIARFERRPIVATERSGSPINA